MQELSQYLGMYIPRTKNQTSSINNTEQQDQESFSDYQQNASEEELKPKSKLGRIGDVIVGVIEVVAFLSFVIWIIATIIKFFS